MSNNKTLKEYVKQRDGGVCLCCGSADNLTVDHVIPLYRGGPTTPANLQTLCRDCNVRKGTKVIDFRLPAAPPSQFIPLTQIQQCIENLKKIKTYLR